MFKLRHLKIFFPIYTRSDWCRLLLVLIFINARDINCVVKSVKINNFGKFCHDFGKFCHTLV